MKKIPWLFILFFLSLFSFSQDVRYLPKGRTYQHQATAEAQMKFLDSLWDQLSSNIKTYTRTDKSDKTGRKYYYWENGELRLHCYLYTGADEKGIMESKMEFFYFQNEFMGLKATVKYKKDGTYYSKDRYYVYRGALVGWKKFGKRVSTECEEFIKTSTALPGIGMRIWKETQG